MCNVYTICNLPCCIHSYKRERLQYELYHETEIKDSPNSGRTAKIKYAIYRERNAWKYTCELLIIKTSDYEK